jgi:hypothetical protein
MKPRLQKGINICKNQWTKRVFFKIYAETFICLIVFHSNAMSVPNSLQNTAVSCHDEI